MTTARPARSGGRSGQAFVSYGITVPGLQVPDWQAQVKLDLAKITATAASSSCWPDAPTRVPEYLQYLAAHGVGLNAYQLQPGYLIKSYSNLADPTTMNSRTWSCTSDAESQPGQGAGSLLKSWFEQRNG